MSKNLLNVFIGYDPVESVAWHTLAASIYENSKQPVSLIPINIRNLTAIFTRERDPKQSNEFSLTRFLVPYLMDYKGMAIFMDCDMLLKTDISEVFEETSSCPNKAVYVVKHDYVPKNKVKYLGTVQHAYPRKNWSSFVVWDCGHPLNRALTPEFVNSATPLELHRFTWLPDDAIGALDSKWNWLVGEYDDQPADVKNIHWTNGGPYFEEFQDVPYANDWFIQNKKMTYVKQRKKSAQNY